jgi:hypothetical protein
MKDFIMFKIGDNIIDEYLSVEIIEIDESLNFLAKILKREYLYESKVNINDIVLFENHQLKNDMNKNLLIWSVNDITPGSYNITLYCNKKENNKYECSFDLS